jgi:hypothetical protein
MDAKTVGFASLYMLLTGFIQVGAQTTKTSPAPVLEEPVFGIVYSPNLVKYEQVPPSLKKLCKGFFDEPGQVSWLYAHLSSGHSEYLVVMSTWKDQDGDSFGASIWIEGSKCRTDESNWTLSGVVPKGGYGPTADSEKLPGLEVPAPKACNSDPNAHCNYTLQSAREEDILRGLVRDALQRSIKAYGADSGFRKAACSAKILKGNESYPIVQQELQAYCSISTH